MPRLFTCSCTLTCCQSWCMLSNCLGLSITCSSRFSLFSSRRPCCSHHSSHPTSGRTGFPSRTCSSNTSRTSGRRNAGTSTRHLDCLGAHLLQPIVLLSQSPCALEVHLVRPTILVLPVALVLPSLVVVFCALGVHKIVLALQHPVVRPVALARPVALVLRRIVVSARTCLPTSQAIFILSLWRSTQCRPL